MYCIKCGSSVPEGTSFCSNCGEKIEKIEPNNNNGINSNNVTNDSSSNTTTSNINTNSSNQNNNSFNSLNNNNSSQEKPDKISLIIGIVSIVLSLILTVLIIPLAILGIVIGLVKKPSNMIGVALNSIAIVISIVVLVSAINSSEFKDYLDKYKNGSYQTSTNYIAGKYNCTGVDDHKDEYLITLHLNEDNTFLYGPYGKLDNNYAKGTYTYEDENKTNASGQYKYYMVTFTGSKDNFIIDGKPADKDFSAKMEFGITNSKLKKEGVVMFVSTYNTYYCYEE